VNDFRLLEAREAVEVGNWRCRVNFDAASTYLRHFPIAFRYEAGESMGEK